MPAFRAEHAFAVTRAGRLWYGSLRLRYSYLWQSEFATGREG